MAFNLAEAGAYRGVPGQPDVTGWRMRQTRRRVCPLRACDQNSRTAGVWGAIPAWRRAVRTAAKLHESRGLAVRQRNRAESQRKVPGGWLAARGRSSYRGQCATGAHQIAHSGPLRGEISHIWQRLTATCPGCPVGAVFAKGTLPSATFAYTPTRHVRLTPSAPYLAKTYGGLPGLPSWRRIRQRDTPVCCVHQYAIPSRQVVPVGPGCPRRPHQHS